jgi:hypothetical protein
MTTVRRRKKKLITFRLQENHYEELKIVADGTGVSISDLIRICVQGELPKIKEKYVGGGVTGAN